MECTIIKKKNDILKLDIEFVLKEPIKVLVKKGQYIGYKNITNIYVFQAKYFYQEKAILIKVENETLEYFPNEILDRDIKREIEKIL